MNYFFKISTLHEFEVMRWLLGTLGVWYFYCMYINTKGEQRSKQIAEDQRNAYISQIKFIGVLRKQEQTAMPQVTFLVRSKKLLNQKNKGTLLC